MLERKATILSNQHMHAPHLHTHSYPRGRTDGLVYRLKLKSKHGQTVWISQIKTRKVTFFFLLSVCMPAMPQLHPAHLGLPANRLPPSSPVQPMTSYPLQSLLHQFRSPLHAAYGLALPAINPLPFLYYPYSMSSLSSLSPTESPKVLDLSSQTGQGNR